MNKSSTGVGCAAVVGLLIIVAAIMWALAIGLWIFGLIVLVSGMLIGGAVTVGGFQGVGRAKQIREMEAEIQALAEDCARDLNTLQMDWDMMTYTKGIGTPMQDILRDTPQVGERYSTEITRAIQLCESAPATPQRIDAITRGEALRLQLRSKLRP